MKVQIKPIQGYFSFKCMKYRAGDTLEVDSCYFNSDVMTVIPEVNVVSVPESTVVSTVNVEVAEKPKRHRRNRKGKVKVDG